MVRHTHTLWSCRKLTVGIDWVPLSLKGTQRGEVYLEMTFYAAGPAPLTRRPSKFTNPSERLARPQQPFVQQRQRVASQSLSLPSPLSPHGQASPANPQQSPRQGRPKIHQVPLPGPWPGKSAQQQQQQQQPSQHAAPSHHKRRSSKGEDAPLPPLPVDAEPKEDTMPSILRPGGPPRTVMQPIHETWHTPPDPHAQDRHQDRTPPPSMANGAAVGAVGRHHVTDPHPVHSYPPHPSTTPFPGSLGTQDNISSSSSQPQGEPQPHGHRLSLHSTRGTPGHVGYPLGGHWNTQPPQAQPELPHAQYNPSLQQQPQQQHHIQHSPREEAQPSASSIHRVSSYTPDNHPSTQPYVAVHVPGSAPPSHSHTTSPSPTPPSHSYIASHSPPPPSHIATPSPVPLVPPAHSYTPATSNLVSPSLSHAATPHPIPFVPPPPTQPFVTASSPIPPTQIYVTNPVLSAQSYTSPTSPPPRAHQYVPPAHPTLVPPVQSLARSTSPSAQPIFPLPTSPPPMPPYSSYSAASPPHFPTPSFPVAQTKKLDYFGTAPATAFPPQDAPNSTDPYRLKRYETPLPLPLSASHPPSSGSAAEPKPKPKPEPSSAPVMKSSRRGEDVDERTARELQRREEEIARARREQEERDAELARTLDMELNFDRGREDAPPPPHLPTRQAGIVSDAMPGGW
jgi:hypothetical protein